jgi:hypothetical protein
MTLVVDKFRSLLPARSKTSPSGWTSFNAPCCHHRGHKPDTRKRAGIRFDSGIVYNCFNCKFSTGWQPGSLFGEKMKTLCKWLGADENDIKQLIFESLKTESDNNQTEKYQAKEIFSNKTLPEGSMPLLDWVNSEYWDDIAPEVEKIISYVDNRGHDPFDGNFYWTPAAGYENRVIIPFRYQGRIVGNTARKVLEGKPKYISDQQPNYVFNTDICEENQKYIFVVEGPFDALSINGLAVLSNDISDIQSKIIKSLNSEVIIIPDQDLAGLELYDKAIKYDWSIANPNWDNDIKDVADAVLRYGKLFVIVDAIKTAVSGEIKIKMAKKSKEHKLKRLLHEKNI